jgi:hypothetical protein
MKQLFDQTFIWGFIFGVTLSNVGHKIIKLSAQTEITSLGQWLSLFLSIALLVLSFVLYRKNRHRISALENTIELVAESSQH